MAPSDGIWVHRDGNSLKIHPSQAGEYEKRGWQRSDPSFLAQVAGALPVRLAGQPPFEGAVRMVKTNPDGQVANSWAEKKTVDNMKRQGWSVADEPQPAPVFVQTPPAPVFTKIDATKKP